MDSSASGVTQVASRLSVMTQPGMTQLTRMPHGPSSRAKVWATAHAAKK